MLNRAQQTGHSRKDSHGLCIDADVLTCGEDVDAECGVPEETGQPLKRRNFQITGIGWAQAPEERLIATEVEAERAVPLVHRTMSHRHPEELARGEIEVVIERRLYRQPDLGVGVGVLPRIRATIVRNERAALACKRSIVKSQVIARTVFFGRPLQSIEHTLIPDHDPVAGRGVHVRRGHRDLTQGRWR